MNYILTRKEAFAEFSEQLSNHGISSNDILGYWNCNYTVENAIYEAKTRANRRSIKNCLACDNPVPAARVISKCDNCINEANTRANRRSKNER